MAHNRPHNLRYVQCPLWVISGHFSLRERCLLYPQKRTSVCALHCAFQLIGNGKKLISFSRREKDGMLLIRVPGTSYKDGRDKRLPQNNAGESILPT